jgi:hypothetical protein
MIMDPQRLDWWYLGLLGFPIAVISYEQSTLREMETRKTHSRGRGR